MADAFAEYCNASSADFKISEYGEQFRVFGRQDGEVEPIGISYHRPVNWNDLNRGEIEGNLNPIIRLADMAGVPAIWIGETNPKWESNSGQVEFGVFGDSVDSFVQEPDSIPLASLEERIQATFGTGFDELGVTKGLNVGSVDDFQDWGRKHLPTNYLPQDIDLLATADSRPIAWIELKRSNFDFGRYTFTDWLPFNNDINNFKLQTSLHEESGVRPLAVHQKKYRRGRSVNDSEQVQFVDLDGDSENTIWVNPDDGRMHQETRSDFSYSIDDTSAKEAKQRINSLR